MRAANRGIRREPNAQSSDTHVARCPIAVDGRGRVRAVRRISLVFIAQIQVVIPSITTRESPDSAPVPQSPRYRLRRIERNESRGDSFSIVGVSFKGR